MNRREFLKKTMTGAAAAGLAGCSSLQSVTRFAEKEKLNVLFIMTDQHNAHVLGCNGNKVVKTPNMDRLAREGVNFTRAFTQTGQCCPARYTAWTGRYAHSHGCRWNGVREPLEEVTIGEVFKDSGYVTASIGKHHMKNSLADHGFDHVIDMKEFLQFQTESGSPHPYNQGDWLTTKISNARVGASAADNEHHPAGYWTDETIKFLRANKDKPFCAWYSFYGPHTPITPSRPWANMYKPADVPLPGNFDYERDESAMPAMLINPRRAGIQRSEEEHREVLAYYYGLVSQIDYNIGRVLDELDDLGLADKTIVVYTADHGEMASEHRCWTKFVLNYDATVRIPMIVRLPGGERGGRTCGELVGLIDLMPTLCELAGQPVPEQVQGKSLVPLLKGEKAEWRNTIFSEIGYPGQGAQGLCSMARTKTHKYIHHENNGNPMEELFDLEKDPWETKNLAGDAAYAEVENALRREVEEWYATTDNAPMYPVEGKNKAKK